MNKVTIAITGLAFLGLVSCGGTNEKEMETLMNETMVLQEEVSQIEVEMETINDAAMETETAVNELENI